MRFRLERAVPAVSARRIPVRLSAAFLVVLALALLIAGALPAAAETTTCYAVADEGGGDGTGLDQFAEDLLTRIDISDADPATNETSIGTGTGSFDVEASAFQPGMGVLYAVDGGRLGILDLETGAFTARPSDIGTGSGAGGSIEFDDVDGLTFDPDTGTLYGSQRVRTEDPDVLLVIDPETGARVTDAFGSGDDYLQITPLPGEMKIDDLAIVPDGTLYAIANEGGHGDRLVTIDRDTGALTEVGPTGQDDMEGLAVTPDGGLVGVSGKEGSIGGAVWDIDAQTGTASNPRPIDNGSDYESIACIAAQAPPPPEVASITIAKDASPDVALDFSFAGDLGKFALGGGAGATAPSTKTFGDLDAGTYEIVEQPTEGWKLKSIACTDPDGDTETTVASAKATIDLDAGEDVMCTFKNVRLAVLGGPVLPPTGSSGLGVLSLVGGGMVAAGGALRSLGGSAAAATAGARKPSTVTARRVEGSVVRRRPSRPTVRRPSAIARIAAPERGPPRSRAP